MKNRKMYWLYLVVFLLFGIWSWAEEQKEAEAEKEKAPPAQVLQPRVRPDSINRGPGRMIKPRPTRSPDELYRNRYARQEVIHNALIKELKEIKKVAEEEGASRTAEAIQKMIKKHQAQFKQDMQAMEKRQQEMQRRMEQRMKERQARMDQPASPGTSEDELKKQESKEDTSEGRQTKQ